MYINYISTVPYKYILQLHPTACDIKKLNIQKRRIMIKFDKIYLNCCSKSNGICFEKSENVQCIASVIIQCTKTIF